VADFSKEGTRRSAKAGEITLNYYEAGEGSADRLPLVMLHGGGPGASAWSNFGRALTEGTPLQRAWRDAHAGRVHAANDPERALQMYGAHEFGHKIDPGMY